MLVKVKNNPKLKELPKYSTPYSAGCDVRANLSLIQEDKMFGGAYITPQGKAIMPPNSRMLIPTAINMAVPIGYEVQARPRSGLALKYGITLTNCVGTIDSDYRGDCGFILHNTGNETFEFDDNERIGQFVLAKVEQIEWDVVDELDETERGEGGYGHTGRG